MDCKLYIFGVPDGFELYEGRPDEIQYFLTYDDSSKVNSKLTVHRRGNGQIVYSYLCYNLVTSGGRQGAFLGISVVYTGKYCVDVTSLYDLFKAVYNTILQQGTLLKSVNNQTVFCVPAFKDAGSEINRIKAVLLKNLDTAFVNDFQPLDNKFKQGINLDKVVELNNEVGNEAIIRAFEEYPMISISPEFSGGIIKTPPIDGLNEELAQIKREKNQLSEKKDAVDVTTGQRKEGAEPKGESNMNLEKQENGFFKSRISILLSIIAVVATFWCVIEIYEIIKFWINGGNK